MKYALIILSIFAISIAAQGQDYQTKQAESSMKISGTSTLHDWHINVESFNGSAKMDGGKLDQASFEADVKSLKSGTSSMDDNTYEALEAEDYPKITFKSTEIISSDVKLTIKGNLTIAGATRPVTLSTTIEKWAEKSITIKGSYSFKMSEFGIDPPRAMFGTIRTGDEIDIAFNLVLYK